MRITPSLILVLVAVLGAASGCAPSGEARDGVRAPQGVTPGLRLPWKEVSEKISDWSFASDQQLDRDPNARVGIRQRSYPVRVRRVLMPEQWDAVLAAYARKYGPRFHQYDFPKVGNTSRGRIYELESRS